MNKQEVLIELKEVLGLDKLPRKIETFDISNISTRCAITGSSISTDTDAFSSELYLYSLHII